MNLSSPVIKNFKFNFEDALFQQIYPNPKQIPYIQKNQSINFYLKLRRPATQKDIVSFDFINSYTEEK